MPQQTFPPIIWILTEGECDGDEIKSRLLFKTFFTLSLVLTNSRIGCANESILEYVKDTNNDGSRIFFYNDRLTKRVSIVKNDPWALELSIKYLRRQVKKIYHCAVCNGDSVTRTKYLKPSQAKQLAPISVMEPLLWKMVAKIIQWVASSAGAPRHHAAPMICGARENGCSTF